MKNFNPTYIPAVEAVEESPASTVWTIDGPHGSTFTCTESEDTTLTCSIDRADADMKLKGNTGYFIDDVRGSVKTLRAGIETEDEYDGNLFGWDL
jgi:hypothetical protein